MSNIYKIADLLIEFEYNFDFYFKGNIEKYKSKETEASHTIISTIVDEIEKPSSTPIISKDNRFIYREDNIEYLLVTNDYDSVDILIKYDLEYKKINLYFQKDIKNIEEKEYIFTGIMFMDLALSKSYVSIHASGIVLNNKGILFSAPSKTGKSTHARFWLEEYPEAYIFNDDKPLIRAEEEIFVYGTPWSGKTTVNHNIRVRLQSIVFLEQGKTNEIRDLSNKEKLIYLMRNINRPRSKELWEHNLSTLNKLIKNINMFQANVTNSIESVSVVANTIVGENNES